MAVGADTIKCFSLLLMDAHTGEAKHLSLYSLEASSQPRGKHLEGAPLG